MKPLPLFPLPLHAQPKKVGQGPNHKGRKDSIFKARGWVRPHGRKEKLLHQ